LLEYERVAARIYDLDEPTWSRVWQLVVPVNLGEQVKDAFFRSLSWQGYRQITPGLFARPGAGGAELQTMLEEYSVRDNVLLMNADESVLSSRVALREVIDTRWKLDEVAADYRIFLKRFQPLQRWLSQKSSIDTEAALIIRLLLVHEYRRLLLKDTPLPAVLLPSSWPGTKAKLTAAGIYRQVANPSVTYIMAHLEGLHGLLPEPSKQFTQRFTPQPIVNAN
jgi:phenylacetic acid degradation operon negative regulatory protein